MLYFVICLFIFSSIFVLHVSENGTKPQFQSKNMKIPMAHVDVLPNEYCIDVSEKKTPNSATEKGIS